MRRTPLQTTLAALMAAAVLTPMAVPAHAAAKEWVSPPNSFQFTGAGWGHGVGMSQYGARGMAQAGKSADQILEHYYNPAQVTQESRYATSDIRVQVLSSTTATMYVTGGKAKIKDGSATRTASESITYKISGGKLSYTVDGKQYTTSNKVTITWEGTRAWPSSKKAVVSVLRANDGWGSVAYRHGMMTVGVLKDKVNVVNQLRLNDEYLYGLAEVPSSWEPAALQSQAIAGRTYAMKNMSSTKSSCDCNVYDEVASQKFTGWNKENEAGGAIGARWKSAVDATISRKSGVIKTAKVVKHNGALIDAVYSSSTGGKTRAAKDVWGYPHAYLQSRDDSWALKSGVKNPNASWVRTISQSQAERGFGLNDIVDIDLKKNSDLSIASATATDKTGKKSTITGSKLRSLIGARAAWVSSVKTVGGEQQSSPATPPVYQSTVKGQKFKTTNNLNMREAPENGKVIKVLAPNTEVTTTGKASGTKWLQVTGAGKTGWVSKAYLKDSNSYKPTTGSKPKPVDKPKPKPTTKKVTTHTTTAALNLRASAVSGKVVTTMKKGATVKPTGKTAKSGTWIQVKYGSKTGWASKKYIKTATKTVTVANGSSTSKASKKTVAALNLRSGAGTKYKVLTTIPKGKSVTVHGSASKSGWVKTSYGKHTGHVSAKYLK